ncbi:FecR domain-containing protein [Phormidium sp. CLA17]|uniref:FecR family protein n=1 Tax=Leptolyngbya sp. Cla-17 TaxID=2803751 RepID=UPI0014918EA1|nr:FecR domain-containing protein [Leptolyngbya sp. Cla-17]MBM0744251.1 FecR domain-containing protein [Leptolyngbya sp. Cla-17]
MKRRAIITTSLTLGIIGWFFHSHGNTQQSVRVRVDRVLEVRSTAGKVDYLSNAFSRPVQIGDVLRKVGDGVATGTRSKAVLFVDTGIGVVDVSENADLRIAGLATAPDNGRIIRLRLTKGQVRLRVRRFTHRGSQLDIQTPASLSGVRGTEFGVAVQLNGKTGLAVLQGAVASAAQRQGTAVTGGFQNFTMPGEPPSAPVPLKNDTRLRYDFERVIEGGIRKIKLRGQVDSVNNVMVDGKPQVTDRSGKFATDLQALPTSLSFQVVVTTPLGKQQSYSVAFR